MRETQEREGRKEERKTEPLSLRSRGVPVGRCTTFAKPSSPTIARSAGPTEKERTHRCWRDFPGVLPRYGDVVGKAPKREQLLFARRVFVVEEKM